MSGLSSEHRKCKYRVDVLKGVLDSKGCKKETKALYDEAVSNLEAVEKKIEGSMSDTEASHRRWIKKIKSLIADARLDLEISEDLKERLISDLEMLAESVSGHED